VAELVNAKYTVATMDGVETQGCTAGSNPVLTTKIKDMEIDTKNKLKIAGMMIVFISLFLYSFYLHRNEPHWFETRYVKIIK
tara:strand:- start:499 stop:744 length:246 start_codon:yes stop_codon:yes gene_type:complete